MKLPFHEFSFFKATAPYLSLKYAILQNQKKFKKLLTNNNAYVSIYELSLRNDKRTTKFFKKKVKKVVDKQ